MVVAQALALALLLLLLLAEHPACAAASGMACDLVRDCGARADNSTNAEPAFAACLRRGCTQITFPRGAVFRSGSLDFSNTTGLTLAFEDGAQLWGSTDPQDYPVQGFLPYMGNATQWRALLCGRNVTGLTITGPASAIVDGNGWPWWANFSRGTLENSRPKLLEVVDCAGLRVEGMTFRNSAFWQLHPIFCDDVVFSGVTVLAPRAQGNTDGIDPDSCTNVLIEGCHIDVGDDGISIKSGWHDRTLRLMPAANVTVVNTTILARNFAVGSACFGGVFNITVRDSVIGDLHGSSPWAAKIKSHTPNGGIVQGVAFANVSLGVIAPNTYQQPGGGMAFTVYENYGLEGLARELALPLAHVHEVVGRLLAEGLPGPHQPVPPATVIDSVSLRSVHAAGARWAGQFAGLAGSNLTRFVFEDVVFDAVSEKTPWECSFMSETRVAGRTVPPLPQDCGL